MKTNQPTEKPCFNKYCRWQYYPSPHYVYAHTVLNWTWKIWNENNTNMNMSVISNLMLKWDREYTLQLHKYNRCRPQLDKYKKFRPQLDKYHRFRSQLDKYHRLGSDIWSRIMQENRTIPELEYKVAGWLHSWMKVSMGRWCSKIWGFNLVNLPTGELLYSQLHIKAFAKYYIVNLLKLHVHVQ